jgi:hypothetical protein
VPAGFEYFVIMIELANAGKLHCLDQSSVDPFAFVSGAERAAEAVPDRARIVGFAVLEGVLERFGGEQAGGRL